MTQDDTNDTEQGSGFDPLSTTGRVSMWVWPIAPTTLKRTTTTC